MSNKNEFNSMSNKILCLISMSNKILCLIFK